MQWNIAKSQPPQKVLQSNTMHPIVLQVLWNRGIFSEDEIEQFLYPSWEDHTESPWVFSHMSLAVDRIWEALEKKQKITIHGDYDADGVCGTAMLYCALRDLSRAIGITAFIDTYIPHRQYEGYGISVSTVDTLQKKCGTNLLISVDCGISNADAVAKACSVGMDVIVCDHHTLPDVLPTAIIIHPSAPNEIVKNKHLCGTGVAFKLVCALFERARENGVSVRDGAEKWFLDLVAIANVTDVMKLEGENRVLQAYGMKVLNKTKRFGLQAVCTLAGLEMGKIDARAIGFQIGPRLNAAGRVDHAKHALDLLLEENASKAFAYAETLELLNKQRQKSSDEMYKQAKEQIGTIHEKQLIVAVEQGWNPGLAGLVAGKLVSDYQLPVLVVAQNGDRFVGSGRSVGDFDITALLTKTRDLLEKFGGHKEACGFSVIGEERFVQAVEAMKTFALADLSHWEGTPFLDIDALIDLADVSLRLFEQLQLLSPHGNGNPKPLFASRHVAVEEFRCVGNADAHLKLSVSNGRGTMLPAIAFKQGHLADRLDKGTHIDIAFTIDLNQWNGYSTIQLNVEEILLCT